MIYAQPGVSDGNLPSRHASVAVGRRRVGIGHPSYLIAEIGSNHDQDLQRALDMISAAAAAGADAVKFQSLRFDRLYKPGFVTPGFREWFAQIELDEAWYPALAERAARERVDFLSSPTYVEALDLLMAQGVPALKIASPQVQGNPDLLVAAARTGLPLIMSIGYCRYEDIGRALTTCLEAGNDQLVFLHCIAKYPIVPKEANLRFMNTLGAMTGAPVGYSDHSLGWQLALAAVALGACVLEKHVTDDRGRSGPDHHFAMTFEEFGRMAREVRDVEAALGTGVRAQLLPDEEAMRSKVEMKAFSRAPLRRGDPFGPDNVDFFRYAGEGVPRADRARLFSSRAARDLVEGSVITPGDVQGGDA